MTQEFFASLRGDLLWKPIDLPELSDSYWIEAWPSASDVEKANMANAWLWLMNMELGKSRDDYDSIGNYVSQVVFNNYPWLRLALPYVDCDLFKDAIVNGTTSSILSYSVSLPEMRKEKFTVSLDKLFFGTNNARIEGVLEIAEQLQDIFQNNGDIPRLRNLLQNLAWDVVAEHPDDLYLRACAASISLLYGRLNIADPEHSSRENYLWHALGKLENQYSPPKSYDTVNEIFDFVSKGNPGIAAHNLPVLIQTLHTGKVSPCFSYKDSLLLVMEKPVETITEFDLLRTWIPQKKLLWDSCESLGVSYKDACQQAANESFRNHKGRDLPSNVDLANISLE